MMDFKKNLPKIILALVFLIVIMIYAEVQGAQIIPTLLGFALGGLMMYLFIKKVLKK
jgi:predicted neutral ceramidase superfamily lipid hydrolase